MRGSVHEDSHAIAGEVEKALQDTWPVAATGGQSELDGWSGQDVGAGGWASADHDDVREPQAPLADRHDPDFDEMPASGEPHSAPLAFAVDDRSFEEDFDEGGYAEERRRPRSRRRSALLVAGILGTVVVGGGVAAWLATGDGGTASSGPPPIIKAEAGPTKLAPEVKEQQASVPGQAVYDRVSGQPAAGEEAIVNRAEEPREIAREASPSAESGVERVVNGSGPGKAELRLGEQAAAGDGESLFDPIGPRKVRTFVVRPDGSIMQTAPAAAASEPFPDPAGTTQVAALDNSELLQPTPVRTVDVNLADEGAAAGQAGPAQPPSDLPSAMTMPAATGGETPAAVADELRPTDASNAAALPAETVGGMPRPRPAGAVQTAAVAPAATPAATRPAETAAPAARRNSNAPVNLLEANAAPRATAQPTSTPASGGYVVQLSSQRSAEQAQSTFNALKSRYSSVLGSYSADIQRAEVADKGTYYRVRVGPMATRDQAIGVCEQLKAAGGSCFVTR
ncbi:SPOR domain-containing protein [Faunimonas sp. B44]|uniref:SPOR domain-containing protein n=1 Tax=Faunimonas sp. B44 TaxID=3461493 RepID=UPI004044DCBB